MIVFGVALVLLSAVITGSMSGGGPAVPENITVTFLTPSSVKVSWATAFDTVEKYDVTYKPTDARVVAVVAGNSDTVTLSGLKADTQYQVTVAAVWRGKKYRSRPIVFRTLEQPVPSLQQDPMASTPPETTSSTKDSSEISDQTDYLYPSSSATVRGVEIGIVLLVLFVWVAAIALFFNRWGKIRMLLPYQPDYKQDQLKVPGTVTSTTAPTAPNPCAHHSVDHSCTQGPVTPQPIASQPPPSRPRLNSAIFSSYSGPGIDPKEFFRRHGSVSRLCRKARSVDNLTLDEQIHTTRHFGLPTLSVSGPSPPDEEDDQTVVPEEDLAEETDFFLK